MNPYGARYTPPHLPRRASDRYVHAVRGCARCGQTHRGLEARRFVRPIVDDDGTWTHWAPCPITGDPILIADVPGPEPDADEQDGVLADMHLDDDWPEMPDEWPEHDFSLYDRNVP